MRDSKLSSSSSSQNTSGAAVPSPASPQGWEPIETCPQDGLFLVHEDGAIRIMYRTRGTWEATAVALDPIHGEPMRDIKVRETGVYTPTHWMPLPDPPADAGGPPRDQV
jgi:hypothetical protein